MSRRRVGMIGWGQMGSAIGARLLAAALPLTVFDVSAAACRAAAELGADIANSCADAARGAGTVITMLPDGPAVESAAYGPAGVTAGLDAGTLWIEMSSSHPAVTGKLAAWADEREVLFLDAPVTGGVPRARKGDLTIIAAGSAEALERARPLFEQLAGKVFHVGAEPGMGDVAKTVNNLLSAVNLAAAAEGLTIAKRAGIDLAVLLDVINSGSGQSNATSQKIPTYVLTGAFNSQFSIAQYGKDLGIALKVAGEMGYDLEIAQVTADLWHRFANAGYGSRDHTEVVDLIMTRIETM